MSIFSKLFGKKAPEVLSPVSLATVVADMHSHLIPGIDDGAQTLDDSITLIKGLQAAGFTKLITTPHVMSDFYRNTPQTILGGLEVVQEELIKQNINVTLQAAAEYYLDRSFVEKIKTEKLLSFGKENYVLFELSYVNPPENMHRVIFDLLSAGYKPILAHPERYPFYYDKYDTYAQIREKGALLQLNINSLTGYYSMPTKLVAERMVNDGIIDFIGTDTHKASHLNVLETARRNPLLHKLVNSGKLLNNTLVE